VQSRDVLFRCKTEGKFGGGFHEWLSACGA
jgi:hypothetical protein